jgi:hypothetical protein
MADYYPLLAKAITGLSSNNLETRHAIYDRARTALLRQLASIDPPVAQAIVDRELGALEQVFTRLEMENLEVADVGSKAQTSEDIAPLAETIAPVLDAPTLNTRPKVNLIKRGEAKSSKPILAVGLAIGLVIVVTLATLAYLRRDQPPAMANDGSQITQQSAAPVPTNESAAVPPKASDRVGVPSSPTNTPAPVATPVAPPAPVVQTPSTSAPVTAPATTAPVPTPAPRPPTNPPAIGVANRAILLVQNSDKPDDVSVRQGTVVWRNEAVSNAQSQIADRTIKASIDVPEAKLQMEVTIQRNRDTAFPASHTIQIRSTPSAGSDIGAIQGVTSFEFRQTENQTGYAMAGQGISVMDNLFLIALTQVEPALSRNIEMMKIRPLIYFEFPLASGRRGAILLDKGVSGQQVFDAALNSWQ